MTLRFTQHFDRCDFPFSLAARSARLRAVIVVVAVVVVGTAPR
jgi:hypothetical protein